MGLALSFGVLMSTAVLVAGLGFGDEGKGTTVDYLCAKRNADLVVRYNGGAQAAHNVVLPDGRHHVFAQIGSGFFQGADTFLSRFMLVEPVALLAEMDALRRMGFDPARSLYIDKRAVIITGYHRAANRILERIRGDKGRHGSCGMGVGEARRDELDGLALRVEDLRRGPVSVELLHAIREKKLKELPDRWMDIASEEEAAIFSENTPAQWSGAYGSCIPYESIVDENFLKERMMGRTIIFEGAQGVLLDEDYGFYPYNSWTNTTFANAETLLKENGFNGLIEKCGVLRTYMTRHGAGPFPTELPPVPYDGTQKVEHNKTGPWQGNFRIGNLDLVALRYAVEVLGGVDYLALTHMDCVPEKVCWGYSGTRPEFFSNDARLKPVKRIPREMLRLTDNLFEVKPQLTEFSTYVVERNLGAEVHLQSHGPTCRDKKEVRWTKRNEW